MSLLYFIIIVSNNPTRLAFLSFILNLIFSSIPHRQWAQLVSRTSYIVVLCDLLFISKQARVHFCLGPKCSSVLFLHIHIEIQIEKLFKENELQKKIWWSLMEQWQNGPYKHIEHHETRKTTRRYRHLD